MSRILVVATLSHSNSARETLGVVLPGSKADAEVIAYERFMQRGKSPVDMFSVTVGEFPEGTDIINAMA
jgi:hypothetical protein